MENPMSKAISTLHFLTSSIRNVKNKPHLKDQLEQSLVKAEACDEATAKAAVESFYAGLRAV